MFVFVYGGYWLLFVDDGGVGVGIGEIGCDGNVCDVS